MNIIESWVDESQVREYANKLLSPHHSQQSNHDDGDFIVAAPEEIFVAQKLNQQAGNTTQETQGVDIEKVVQSLTAKAPVVSEEKAAQLTAKKALAQASKLANQSGVVSSKEDTSSSRYAAVEGLDEEQGWSSHRNVSNELKQHLGESAGAVLNREAVADSLEAVRKYLNETWQAQEISISDRDGDIFIDTMSNSALSKLTVTVTEPIRLLDIKQGAIGHGYMHLKVTAIDFLQVVVTSTSHGLIILSMLREAPLRATQVKQLVDDVREMI